MSPREVAMRCGAEVRNLDDPQTTSRKEGMSARDVALRTITFQAPGEETWRRPRKNTEREEMELMAVLGKPWRNRLSNEPRPMSSPFRFSPNSMGVAVTSNPSASSGSVALPRSSGLHLALGSFHGDCANPPCYQLLGLCSRLIAKKKNWGCQNWCLLGGKEKKEKWDFFLICDEENAQECSQCWPEVLGSYFPISKPLWNNPGLSFLEEPRLLAVVAIWESRWGWKAMLTALPHTHAERKTVFIQMLQLLLTDPDAVCA